MEKPKLQTTSFGMPQDVLRSKSHVFFKVHSREGYIEKKKNRKHLKTQGKLLEYLLSIPLHVSSDLIDLSISYFSLPSLLLLRLLSQDSPSADVGKTAFDPSVHLYLLTSLPRLESRELAKLPRHLEGFGLLFAWTKHEDE